MKKSAWNAISLAAIIALLAAVALAFLLGPCPGVIDCGTKTVPMKCFWTFKAITVIGLTAVIAALCPLFTQSKAARRVAAVSAIATEAAALFIASPLGIGLCASADMTCRGNIIPIIACFLIAMVCAVIQLIRADEETASRPKMTI